MQTRAGNTERYCLHALANAGALILTEVDLARYCPHVSACGTSRTNMGALILQVVDLKELELNKGTR